MSHKFHKPKNNFYSLIFHKQNKTISFFLFNYLHKNTKHSNFFVDTICYFFVKFYLYLFFFYLTTIKLNLLFNRRKSIHNWTKFTLGKKGKWKYAKMRKLYGKFYTKEKIYNNEWNRIFKEMTIFLGVKLKGGW